MNVEDLQAVDLAGSCFRWFKQRGGEWRGQQAAAFHCYWCQCIVSSMLSRRELFSATAPMPLVRAQSRRKPNFLFLIADDHAGYVLGADGNKLALTPNLDRLASQGTRFAAHHCNSPVCTPSRQSFFTGQMPHMAGVTRLPTPLSDQKPTLAKQFRVAGYKTAVFGKMHFNRPAESGLHGF